MKQSAENIRVTSEKAINQKFIVHDICHYYKDAGNSCIESLANINLVVKDNEFLSIVGPSGCGKSSLLNVMSGLIQPARGTVFLDGSEIKGITSQIGYISQEDSLLPWRTVLGNVEFGLEIRGLPKKKRQTVL